MDDLISRQAAIGMVRDVCDAILSQCGSHYDGDDEVYDNILEVDAVLKCNKEIRIALANMPSAQGTKLAEWCDDCKEYDKERHCCPRWNRVIRNTVEELKAEHAKEAPQRMHGRWIERIEDMDGMKLQIMRCSECGSSKPMKLFILENYEFNFCPRCGAHMEGAEDDA